MVGREACGSRFEMADTGAVPAEGEAEDLLLRRAVAKALRPYLPAHQRTPVAARAVEAVRGEGWSSPAEVAELAARRQVEAAQALAEAREES
jgi:hypothetical protein